MGTAITKGTRNIKINESLGGLWKEREIWRD